MDVLHPTISAMMASPSRELMELAGVGRWSASIRVATGARSLLLVLPGDSAAELDVMFDAPETTGFDGKWLGVLRPIGIDLDLPLHVRRLAPGDDLLRGPRREFAHGGAGAVPALVVPFPDGGSRTGWAIAVGAEARHQRRFEAAVSSLGGDIGAALRRQVAREQMLRSLMRVMPLAAFVVGVDRRVRTSSSAARDLFGLAETRITLGELQEATGIALAPLVEVASRGGARVSTELEGPRGPLRIDAVGLAEPEAGDMPSPVLVTIEDQSERRRVARQQNEFLSTVGHELRTPLTSLRTSLELLRDTPDLDDEERAKLLGMACRNSLRLDNLIAELLDTARQRAGHFLIEPELVNLASTLARTLEDAAHTASRTERQLDVQLDHALTGWVDPVRLVEIAEAMIANALKFTPSGGSIEVCLRGGAAMPAGGGLDLVRALDQRGEGVELRVEDDGTGMDDNTRRRAFEPFFQDGDPLGDRPAGAGLGLSIVRALAEAHGGRVRLESSPGEGTRVSVWLPAGRRVSELLEQLGRMEEAALEVRKAGHGVALELVRPGTESSAVASAVLELPDGVFAHLLLVSDDWRPSGPCARRIGNDGEPIGTSLANLWTDFTTRTVSGS